MMMNYVKIINLILCLEAGSSRLDFALDGRG